MLANASSKNSTAGCTMEGKPCVCCRRTEQKHDGAETQCLTHNRRATHARAQFPLPCVEHTQKLTADNFGGACLMEGGRRATGQGQCGQVTLKQVWFGCPHSSPKWSSAGTPVPFTGPRHAQRCCSTGSSANSEPGLHQCGGGFPSQNHGFPGHPEEIVSLKWGASATVS